MAALVIERYRMQEQTGKKSVKAFDVAVYVLAGLLVVVLGAASIYGFRYANVDESVATGNITIRKNDSELAKIKIDEELNAHVDYMKLSMQGKLKLAGAEKDTILFQLTDITLEDGSDTSDLVFFIRMPRSGLQGDFSGAWMLYLSRPSKKVTCGDWIIASSDKTALSGRLKKNVITMQRSALVEKSSDWTWNKKGNSLILEAATGE